MTSDLTNSWGYTKGPVRGILFLLLKVLHLRTKNRFLYSNYYTLLRAQAKLLSTEGHGKCFLKVFELLKVVEYLVCKPILDDGNLGSVLSHRTSPHIRLSWGR
jgi:hypothetical protein